MVATTNPSDGTDAVASGRILRFDRTERVVHWCNAVLFLVLVATGAVLYVAPLSTLVANRAFVKNLHVYSGLVLPLPIVIGLLVRSGRMLRVDVFAFGHWTAADRDWWSWRRRARAQLGKFNPGQKLNAVFVGASIVVMLGTGIIMRWFDPFPLEWRTGATFVHDWFAIALFFVIVGHIMFALGDRESLRAMVRGRISQDWARARRPGWYAALVASGEAGPHADAVGDGQARVEQGGPELGSRAREVSVVEAVDGRAGDGIGGGELE
jgi:formate dehydrogenase subunit gamma